MLEPIVREVLYTDGSVWHYYRMSYEAVAAAIEKHCREFNVSVKDYSVRLPEYNIEFTTKKESA